MMSLKSRLRISIIGLMTALVLAQSVLSLRNAASAEFRDAQQRAEFMAQQARILLEDLLNKQAVLAQPRPSGLEETKALWESFLETDPSITELLAKQVASSSVVVEIMICGETGRILASSSAARTRLTYRSLPDLDRWNIRPLWERLREVLTSRSEYAAVVPLGVAERARPIFTIRVIVSSVLMRNELLPQVRSVAATFAVSLLAAVLVAVAFSNVVLRALERLRRRIERIAEGKFEPEDEGARASREVASVESKLDLLSEQFRGAREDATQLRGNIERLLEGLEEAVLLFDPDERLALAGPAAERVLGRSLRGIAGCPLKELFPDSTALGAALRQAVEGHRSFRDRLFAWEGNAGPSRLQVTVEMLENYLGLARSGVLVTLRDADRQSELRTQLDVSTRLAAISRLTGGVAHEIKNPLNAIALHLEVLEAKLAEPEQVQGEVEVIRREIARLDRVVKTFLDFTRPVELRMSETDLVELGREVAALIRPEAGRQAVRVEFKAGLESARIQADRDLVKQAILNVVVNGVEAMENGGKLELGLSREGDDYVVSVADQGKGIPAELREKIFQLYFTTKETGSGIGLAMAYRAVQLHNATIDFASETGKGTTCRLRFPAAGKAWPDEAGENAIGVAEQQDRTV